MPAPDVLTTPSRRSGVGGWLGGLVMLGGWLVLRKVVRGLTGGRSPRQPRVSQEAVQAGHETREAPIWPVIVGGAVLVTVLGMVLITATRLQAGWVGRPLTLSPPPGRATPVPPAPPPEPRVEEIPSAQLRDFRAAEDTILKGTAWVDRQAGTARIPIDRAIDMLAEHPLPARSAEEAGQYADESAGLPSGASSGRVPTGRLP